MAYARGGGAARKGTGFRKSRSGVTQRKTSNPVSRKASIKNPGTGQSKRSQPASRRAQLKATAARPSGGRRKAPRKEQRTSSSRSSRAPRPSSPAGLVSSAHRRGADSVMNSRSLVRGPSLVSMVGRAAGNAAGNVGRNLSNPLGQLDRATRGPVGKSVRSYFDIGNFLKSR